MNSYDWNTIALVLAFLALLFNCVAPFLSCLGGRREAEDKKKPEKQNRAQRSRGKIKVIRGRRE